MPPRPFSLFWPLPRSTSIRQPTLRPHPQANRPQSFCPFSPLGKEEQALRARFAVGSFQNFPRKVGGWGWLRVPAPPHWVGKKKLGWTAGFTVGGAAQHLRMGLLCVGWRYGGPTALVDPPPPALPCPALAQPSHLVPPALYVPNLLPPTVRRERKQGGRFIYDWEVDVH